MTRPWLKFYPADWRADPRLRLCSLGARGLWIELVGLMHESEPYGHLAIDGAPPAAAMIAALVGRPAHEVAKALAELEARRVFDRAANGAIVSRRMVRDRAKDERDRANGKAGGNPHLIGRVNPADEGKDKAQTPESRLQNPEKKENGARGPRAARYSQVFEEKVWQPYPRTPVMSKAEAWKAFAKASPEDQAAIIAAIPRYAAWLRQKPDHPPVHACRFITQRRFEGFAAEAAPAAAALVVIRPDTPEWAAWWDFYGARRNSVGASFGQSRMRQARDTGAAHREPTQWPPGFAPKEDAA